MDANVNNQEIVLIDDDPTHLNIYKEKLERLNFKNVKCFTTFKDLQLYLSANTPALIIADFYLDKNKTALNIIDLVSRNDDIAIIVLSTFYNEDLLSKLNSKLFLDLLSKSCSDFELLKTIKLSSKRFDTSQSNKQLKDSVFVKSGKFFRKIDLASIEYVIVDGKYLDIHIVDKIKYTVRSTLNDFIDLLPVNFVKVSQSAIVNLSFVDYIGVDDSIVKTRNGKIPYSRNFKKKLLNSYYLA